MMRIVGKSRLRANSSAKNIQDVSLIFFEFKFDATRQEMQWELCTVFAVAFLFKVSILIVLEYYFDLVQKDYPNLPSTSSLFLSSCPLGSVFEMSLGGSAEGGISLKVGMFCMLCVFCLG